MAKSKQKPAAQVKTKPSEPNITRIKAGAGKSARKVAEKPIKNKTNQPKSTSQRKTPKILQPVAALGRYLRGAWQELRLVIWPNRKSTWGMTLAVALYSIFFLVVVVLLDAIFDALFKLIIG